MTIFLDLFSGIGGFALGAQWAGIEFDRHYFSEIDKYAVEVYRKRFPEAEALGDVRDVDYRTLPEGDYFVTAGFPCQPHSDAGKKKGAEDERDLWGECRRMLRELRPAIAIFENVRGLFSSPGGKRKGEFFNGVLSDIHGSGYDAEWQTISAADVGAPHIRKRIWIICYKSGGYHWRTPDANMERGNRSYENMKKRIEQGKPLNLNDQLNAIEKGLLPSPMIGTPTRAMCKRSSEFASGRLPNPAEYVQMLPTPSANKTSKSGEIINADGTPWDGISKPYSKKTGKPIQTALADTVKRFPTPRARSGNRACRHGQGGLDLQTAVQIFPTPLATDGDKNSRNKKEHLPGAVLANQNGGQLNAEFVEALMGYPIYWTDTAKETVEARDFPAAWLDSSWEEGIPRVITGQKKRIARLKCLGNAVVPQIPMLLWLLIKGMKYEC